MLHRPHNTTYAQQTIPQTIPHTRHHPGNNSSNKQYICVDNVIFFVFFLAELKRELEVERKRADDAEAQNSETSSIQ
jgi:hypothetical protein